MFLNDLNEYSKSNAQSPYYFGHFLFEEKIDSFTVIDGQQRLSTIVI
ncbi:GmrSD restriction endonuclease domain-containing protein [Psychromonas arctica]